MASDLSAVLSSATRSAGRASETGHDLEHRLAGPRLHAATLAVDLELEILIPKKELSAGEASCFVYSPAATRASAATTTKKSLFIVVSLSVEEEEVVACGVREGETRRE